jgi:hypothetical protein
MGKLRAHEHEISRFKTSQVIPDEPLPVPGQNPGQFHFRMIMIGTMEAGLKIAEDGKRFVLPLVDPFEQGSHGASLTQNTVELHLMLRKYQNEARQT